MELGSRCRYPATELLCRTGFPSCTNYTDGATTKALPASVCASSCFVFETVCGGEFKRATNSPVTCAPVASFDVGTPPATELQTPQCSNLLLSLNSTLLAVCPLQIYPEHKSQTMYIWIQVLSWIGFFLNLAIVILILFDPLRRNSLPGHTILCLHVCLALLSFALSATSWVGWRSIGCANHYHLCKFAAVLVSFSSLAASAWLFFSAALVACQLYVRSSRWVKLIEPWRVRWALHAFAWTYGAVFTAIEPSGYGYAVSVPGCTRLEYVWERYLIWPLITMTLLAALCWLVLVVRLSSMAFNLSRGNSTRSLDSALVRNILFLFSWLLPVAILTCSELSVRSEQRSMRRDIMAWIAGERQMPTPISQSTWWFQYGMTPVAPFLIGLVLGIHPRNLEIIRKGFPGSSESASRPLSRSEQPAFRNFAEEMAVGDEI